LLWRPDSVARSCLQSRAAVTIKRTSLSRCAATSRPACSLGVPQSQRGRPLATLPSGAAPSTRCGWHAGLPSSAGYLRRLLCHSPLVCRASITRAALHCLSMTRYVECDTDSTALPGMLRPLALLALYGTSRRAGCIAALWCQCQAGSLATPVIGSQAHWLRQAARIPYCHAHTCPNPPPNHRLARAHGTYVRQHAAQQMAGQASAPCSSGSGQRDLLAIAQHCITCSHPP
jgi:hypothetical protein